MNDMLKIRSSLVYQIGGTEIYFDIKVHLETCGLTNFMLMIVDGC